MRTQSYALVLLAALVALAGCAARPAAAPAPAGPVLIRYEEGSQFELTSPGGTRLLIDVRNPFVLTSPLANEDVVLTTHSITCDITYYNALKAFTGQQLQMAAGQLSAGDVRITAIPSSDGERLAADPSKAGNYIFVIETGGLRIAHFGVIGQKQLTQEQLAAIGAVDVALMPLANSSSLMSIINKKAFHLMEQVRPRLIIPTHFDAPTARYAVQVWDGAFAPGAALALTPADLPAQPTVLFMGETAPSMGKLLKIAEWGADL